MQRLHDITADTLHAAWPKRSVREGLIAMMAIGLCLAIGALTGHQAAGAIAAGGAFTVGFGVFYPLLESPLLGMTLATLGLATATFAGSLSALWTVAVLIVVGVAGLNYGLLSGLGNSAGWVGQQSAVYLVIATYFPNGPRYALGRSVMLLLGGALQIAIHAGFRARREPAGARGLLRSARQRASDYARLLPRHMVLGSVTLTFALKLVVTMVLATAIYRHMRWANGYWVPMTALLVLKPQWTGTFSRSLARVVGTLSGATVAFGLAQIHAFPTWLVAIGAVVAAFGCYALQAVNYALFSFALTLYIVFVFRFGGFSETAAAHLRLVNTALGGGLALLIDSVWYGIARATGAATHPVHPSDANAGPVVRREDRSLSP